MSNFSRFNGSENDHVEQRESRRKNVERKISNKARISFSDFDKFSVKR